MHIIDVSYIQRLLVNKLKKNGKEAILKFSKWTLTEEMVGDTVYGDMSFKEYIKESFKN